MVTFASTYVLVALSIDRYDAITHPMNFSGSWKRAKLLVISAWLVSALFSTPQFLLYEETLIQGKCFFLRKKGNLKLIKKISFNEKKR
jgi:neuropeptide S receptor 1